MMVRVRGTQPNLTPIACAPNSVRDRIAGNRACPYGVHGFVGHYIHCVSHCAGSPLRPIPVIRAASLMHTLFPSLLPFRPCIMCTHTQPLAQALYKLGLHVSIRPLDLTQSVTREESSCHVLISHVKHLLGEEHCDADAREPLSKTTPPLLLLIHR